MKLINSGTSAHLFYSDYYLQQNCFVYVVQSTTVYCKYRAAFVMNDKELHNSGPLVSIMAISIRDNN